MKQKKPDYFTIIFTAVVGYLFVIILALHSGPSYLEKKNVFTAIIEGASSLINSPANIVVNSGTFICLAYYTVIFAFVALWAKIQSEVNGKIDKEPGGTAKFEVNFKKFQKKYTDLKNPFNNIILTENIALNMNSYQTRRNNNVLVVGGSGSGKTRFMIKPNLLQANCSFVITDPKGEILESEGAMLEKHGYRIKVFNLVDMMHSNSYNPFKYIRDDLGVLMMINCLIKNTNNGQKGGDPFWEKSETALLQALVFYLKDNPSIPDSEKNFTAVMKLLQAAEVNENDPNTQSPLDKLFAKLETEQPNSIAVKQYKTFKMGAGKTLKSILISCAVRLTVFNLQEIENLTMMDDLELKRISDEKTALFVVIPAADDTYNFLVSMMYSQLFETLYYHAENECPYEYYIKESNDVLAIAEKNEKGDKYTERDAKRLLESIKRAPIKRSNKGKYIVKARGFEKTFNSEENAKEYKARIDKAEIVRGAIRLPYPVRFLLDEFANIGQIPDFTKKLATMRQYEISCTIILQNLAQIKTMYKDDWESIVGNCDSFLFLGGQEYSTLEYISKLLGKTTIQNRGRSRNRSAKGGGSGLSIQNQGKELMAVNEISTMPKDECLLIINGMNPFYDKKYNLEKHPHFDESGDSKKGSKFDCKKKILNYGLQQQNKKNKLSAGEEIGANQYIGKAEQLDHVFKDNNINSISDAVERITLKKGQVIVNESINKETGEAEFDYNID